jgi:hypothetical protein
MLLTQLQQQQQQQQPAKQQQQQLEMLVQVPHSNKQRMVLQQSLCRKTSLMQQVQVLQQRGMHKRQLQLQLVVAGSGGSAGEAMPGTAAAAAAVILVLRVLIMRWKGSWSTQFVANRARGKTR